MKFEFRTLGAKLNAAVLGTLVLAGAAFVIAAWPILLGTIREDRIKLFVEQFTGALADNVSHHMENYERRVHTLAERLAAAGGRHTTEIRLLNQAALEPVSGLLPRGIFDLLVIVDRDGTILLANTEDRFGQRLDTTALRGRPIGEFREEERAFLGALAGRGFSDWYRSSMVARTRRPATEDASREYAIAFGAAIGNTGRAVVGVVNWEAVQVILDDVEEPLRRAGFPSGYAFMFARDSDRIIAHKFRHPGKNNYGTRLITDHGLPDLSRAVQEGQLSHRYQYPAGTWKVSGLARVEDATFGWTVGLGINDEDVVAPARLLLWRLGVLGVVLVLLGWLLSRYLSRRITAELSALTLSALRIAEGRFDRRAPVRSRDEVGQLAQAFNTMTEALAQRDEVIRQQQERLFEQRRLEQELHIAAEVQQRLLPQFCPPLATLDYVGYCQPAQRVSGDYFDFVAVAPGKLGLLVADVAGKGLSAALLMSSLHACVRTHAPLLSDRCGEVLSMVNTLLYEATDMDRFATAFYAVYEDGARRLTYVNAGHYPPLVVRAAETQPAVSVASAHGQHAAAHEAAATAPQPATSPGPRWEQLDFGTPPVGLFETLPAVQQSVELFPGDWLLMFSDGVPEAQNDRQEEFGRSRLLDVAAQNRRGTAAEMRDAILGAVRAHCGPQAVSDDLTLIVARVL